VTLVICVRAASLKPDSLTLCLLGGLLSVSEQEKRFPIVEIFGPVIQGEGAMIGHQTHFVRLGGCDFRCSWCDTMYAVLPEEVRANSVSMIAAEIVSKLKSLNPDTPWVTLSGGNPGLHKLDPVVEALSSAGYKVAVETQGTLYKSWLEQCALVTVSPKPPSSGMNQDLSELARFAGLPGINFKVVVFDRDDLAFAREVHSRYPAVPFYLQVGNDLEKDDRDSLLEKLEWLSTQALSDPGLRGAIVLPQLHVLMYGNRRGV
jgi:7-carboxy-7-deazaguanine synthase